MMKKKEERIQNIPRLQKPRHEKKKRQTAASVEGFKPEYCRMLMRHCSQGFSFKSFAARINVLPETLEKWTEEYPEFKEARAKAELKQIMFWESRAVKACREKFSVSIFRYFIVNAVENKPSELPAVVMMPEEDSSK